MKPTFLNQNRPLITGMILKDNPDSIRFAVRIPSMMEQTVLAYSLSG